MEYRRMIALWGATIALSLVPAAGALAAGVDVTVRVEGKSATLLVGTAVHTHAGSITKAGAPAGACPATSAAGALDSATHHHWGAIYSATYHQLELTSILGEAWTFTSPNYWSVWVNHRYAQTGMCQIKLQPGDQILFAVDSSKHHEHPLGVIAPSHTARGHRFTLKVVSFSDNGAATPLAGAHVRGSGLSAVTNRQGIVTVAAPRPGTLSFDASSSGYIRSAPVSVRVAM